MTIARIARFPFPLSRFSIMDIFLRVFCTRAVSLPRALICSPVSFSLLSRVTRPFRPARRHAQNGAAGFNIYEASTCGPFHLVRLPHSTLPLANLPVGILSGYCCSPCARNIDPRANYIVLFRVHTLQSIHSTSGRALFDARQLSWSIVSHSFGNVPKPFSFIHIARSVEIFVRTRWQR